MPATQPHVDSGVLNPADAEPTIDRHASRSARSHKTLDLNALQRSPAPITPRSASTMSLVLNQTRAWKSQESYSFKRDRDVKRASSGYACTHEFVHAKRVLTLAIDSPRSKGVVLGHI